MRKKSIVVFIALFFAITLGCASADTDAPEAIPDEPAPAVYIAEDNDIQPPEPELDKPKPETEPDEPEPEPVAFEDMTPPEQWSYQQRRLSAIREEWGEFEYVAIRLGQVVDNIHLLENWISLFEQGKSAPPLHMLLEYIDGIDLVRLDYDGRQSFTATVYRTDESHTSSHIIRRAFDYVIPIVEGRWYIRLNHTEIVVQEYDYDLDAMPSLGPVSPQEALEIARFRQGQSHSAGLRLGWGPDWFDPNSEEFVEEDYPLMNFTLIGAVAINGNLYYEMFRDSVSEVSLFVSADGSIMLGRFFGYWMIADANEVWITPPSANPAETDSHS